jgi:hypothetical protein
METPKSLTVKFKFDQDDFEKIDELDDSLENAVSYRNLGDYEGYELDEDNHTGMFIMTALDSNLLYKTIRPILQNASFLRDPKIETESGSAAEGTLKVIEYPL